MQRRTWILAALSAAGLAACGGGDASPLVVVAADGSTRIDAGVLTSTLNGLPMSSLSAAERASLLSIREEEQLAHDVYALAAPLWPQPVFANIRDSEATHAAAVKALLDRYELADPLAGLPAGTFKSAAFQALYDAYAARSRRSALEAVKVGLEIEELDIRDLTAQRPSIDNADILLVYDHLLRGSRNHLRAYWSVLLQMGGTYAPLYLAAAGFNAIVTSPIETGA